MQPRSSTCVTIQQPHGLIQASTGASTVAQAADPVESVRPIAAGPDAAAVDTAALIAAALDAQPEVAGSPVRACRESTRVQLLTNAVEAAGSHLTPEAQRLWLRYWNQTEREARKDARNALVLYLQPWVKELADRVGSRMPQHVIREELVNEMNKRLIVLIEKYDPTHRIGFELYAGKPLVGACHDFLRRSGWVKRTDRKFRKEALDAKEKFVAESGRDPSDGEWAERLGLSALAFDRKKPRLHGHEMTSLTAADGTLGEHEYLTDHRTVDPQIQAQRSEAVRLLCRGLQEKERTVMLAYYLLGLTMKQIGDQMHLSEARVSQLHARVLKTLRVKFAARRDELL